MKPLLCRLLPLREPSRARKNPRLSGGGSSSSSDVALQHSAEARTTAQVPSPEAVALCRSALVLLLLIVSRAAGDSDHAAAVANYATMKCGTGYDGDHELAIGPGSGFSESGWTIVKAERRLGDGEQIYCYANVRYAGDGSNGDDALLIRLDAVNVVPPAAAPVERCQHNASYFQVNPIGAGESGRYVCRATGYAHAVADGSANLRLFKTSDAPASAFNDFRVAAAAAEALSLCDPKGGSGGASGGVNGNGQRRVVVFAPDPSTASLVRPDRRCSADVDSYTTVIQRTGGGGTGGGPPFIVTVLDAPSPASCRVACVGGRCAVGANGGGRVGALRQGDRFLVERRATLTYGWTRERCDPHAFRGLLLEISGGGPFVVLPPKRATASPRGAFGRQTSTTAGEPARATSAVAATLLSDSDSESGGNTPHPPAAEVDGPTLTTAVATMTAEAEKTFSAASEAQLTVTSESATNKPSLWTATALASSASADSKLGGLSKRTTGVAATARPEAEATLSAAIAALLTVASDSTGERGPSLSTACTAADCKGGGGESETTSTVTNDAAWLSPDDRNMTSWRDWSSTIDSAAVQSDPITESYESTRSLVASDSSAASDRYSEVVSSSFFSDVHATRAAFTLPLHAERLSTQVEKRPHSPSPVRVEVRPGSNESQFLVRPVLAARSSETTLADISNDTRQAELATTERGRTDGERVSKAEPEVTDSYWAAGDGGGSGDVELNTRHSQTSVASHTSAELAAVWTEATLKRFYEAITTIVLADGNGNAQRNFSSVGEKPAATAEASRASDGLLEGAQTPIFVGATETAVAVTKDAIIAAVAMTRSNGETESTRESDVTQGPMPQVELSARVDPVSSGSTRKFDESGATSASATASVDSSSAIFTLSGASSFNADARLRGCAECADDAGSELPKASAIWTSSPRHSSAEFDSRSGGIDGRSATGPSVGVDTSLPHGSFVKTSDRSHNYVSAAVTTVPSLYDSVSSTHSRHFVADTATISSSAQPSSTSETFALSFGSTSGADRTASGIFNYGKTPPDAPTAPITGFAAAFPATAATPAIGEATSLQALPGRTIVVAEAGSETVTSGFSYDATYVHVVATTQPPTSAVASVSGASSRFVATVTPLSAAAESLSASAMLEATQSKLLHREASTAAALGSVEDKAQATAVSSEDPHFSTATTMSFAADQEATSAMSAFSVGGGSSFSTPPPSDGSVESWTKSQPSNWEATATQTATDEPFSGSSSASEGGGASSALPTAVVRPATTTELGSDELVIIVASVCSALLLVALVVVVSVAAAAMDRRSGRVHAELGAPTRSAAAPAASTSAAGGASPSAAR